MARKKTVTRGSLAFAAHMPKHGSQAQMALRLGVAQDQISRWASGAHRPDPRTRARIEEELGIHWRLWDEEPEADAGAA